MIVYAYYKNKWWMGKSLPTVVGTERISSEILEPEDMPASIAESLDQTDKIYIWDLTYYKNDVFRLLYHIGYDFLAGNPKVKEMPSHTCKYLLSSFGECYKITCRTGHKHTCTLYDTKKIIPIYRIEDVIKSFSDGYDMSNPVFPIMQAIKEITYKHDGCTISGIARRTWSAMTRHELKEQIYDCNKVKLPTGETADDYIRPAYHGGYCNARTEADGTLKIYGKGICLDVNSLYPYEMKKPLPIGAPEYHKGKPTEADIMGINLEIYFIYMRIKIEADLKKGHAPCITADNSDMEYTLPDGWIDRTYNDGFITVNREKIPKRFCMTITVTYQEYVLITEQYNIHSIEYIDYVRYSTSDKIFTSYINYYYNKKQKSKGGRRKVAKMMENGLSGSFARRKVLENFGIRYDETEDAPVYYNIPATTDTPSYISIGAAITALARVDIIRHIQKNYDRWLYSDTDSLFLLGADIPSDITISEKLGDFKIEKEYDRIEFIKKKTYAYENNGEFFLTVAGVSGAGKDYMLDVINGKIWDPTPELQKYTYYKHVIKSGEKLKQYEYNEYIKLQEYVNDYFTKDHSDKLKEIMNYPLPTLIREHNEMFSQTYIKQWNMLERINEYLELY